jgi:hypothetical protein
MPRTENKQLTKEIISQTTRSRVAVTVIGAILCVIVFNFVAGWYLTRYSPNIGYLLIAAKWNLVQALANPVDILILGDSSGNQGVDPDVIKEKLGYSSVNLCTIGGTIALDDAWMLDEYLNKHGAPKAVLIVHGYDVWSRDIIIEALSKVPGSWWNRRPDLDLTLKQKVRIYLNRHVPIYAETRSLGQVFQFPFKAFKNGLRFEPSGYVPEPFADPEQVEKDVQVHLDYLDTVKTSGDVLSRPNRKALLFIKDLAEEHQFDVFIANGPVYEVLYADPEFQEYYATVRQSISEIAATSDYLHYILDPPMTFDKNRMQSADHVTSQGARDYTVRLGEEIKSRL